MPDDLKTFDQGDSASETSQAQHQLTNDTPLDVNMNSVVGREQALTFTMGGRSFTSNMDRRDKLFDAAAYREIHKA